MIASVETAKRKLGRESTKLRPIPLSSLLDYFASLLTGLRPCTDEYHLFIPLFEHADDWVS